MKFDDVVQLKTVEDVLQWAKVRKIDEQSPSIALSKVIEEVSESLQAVRVNDYDELKDGLGDTVVTCINYLNSSKMFTAEKICSVINYDEENKKDFCEQVQFIVNNEGKLFFVKTNKEIKQYVALLFNEVIEELGVLQSCFVLKDQKEVKDKVDEVSCKLFFNINYICWIYRTSVNEVLLEAYDVIKNRKGKKINGVFVKEKDLKK